MLHEFLTANREETERCGVLAREVRNAIHTASIAFEVIKGGRVGIAGRTGTLLEQTLSNATELIDRLLAEVYTPNGTKPRS